MKEEWRDIKGYKGLYQISDKGRVKSLDRVVLRKSAPVALEGLVLICRENTSGYPSCSLSKKGTVKTFRVHRLVAIAFIKRIKGKGCVNHIDGVKNNNNVRNLEWASHSDNMIHAIRTGLNPNNHAARLTSDNVRKIRKIYNRRNMNFRKLSTVYGVSRQTIEDAYHRKTWKHVK